MMVSLFSIFDSSSSGLSWLLAPCAMLMLSSGYYTKSSSLSLSSSRILQMLKVQLDDTLYSTRHIHHSLFVIPIFFMIVLWNSGGLLPYVFTPSAHLSVTLGVGLSVWFSFILFGWMNSPLSSLAMLVPSGSPPLLMPFMVLIESVSIIIRPITLSVRLTANMVAGHLLLSLCGSGVSSSPMGMLALFSQTLLFILELAVALIQAYVFMVLVSLYSKEAG